jgi:hypothetical protein
MRRTDLTSTLSFIFHVSRSLDIIAHDSGFGTEIKDLEQLHYRFRRLNFSSFKKSVTESYLNLFI